MDIAPSLSPPPPPPPAAAPTPTPTSLAATQATSHDSLSRAPTLTNTMGVPPSQSGGPETARELKLDEKAGEPIVISFETPGLERLNPRVRAAGLQPMERPWLYWAPSFSERLTPAPLLCCPPLRCRPQSWSHTRRCVASTARSRTRAGLTRTRARFLSPPPYPFLLAPAHRCRAFIATQGALSMLAVTFGTSAYTGGIPGLEAKFGVGSEVATLGLSTFTLALALGSLFWAPLSEVIGRRLVLLSSLSIYVLFGLGPVLAQNIETILITRLVPSILRPRADQLPAHATVGGAQGGFRASRSVADALAPALAAPTAS